MNLDYFKKIAIYTFFDEEFRRKIAIKAPHLIIDLKGLSINPKKQSIESVGNWLFSNQTFANELLNKSILKKKIKTKLKDLEIMFISAYMESTVPNDMKPCIGLHNYV